MEFEPTQPQVEEFNAQPQANEGIATGEATPAEPTAEPQSEASANPYKLKIKYNGAEEELDEENARTLAQKGKNYDHIFDELKDKREKVERYESHRGLKFLEASAKRLGMSVDELVERMEAEEIRKQDMATAAKTNKPIEVVQAERIASEAQQRAQAAEMRLTESEKAAAEKIKQETEIAEFVKQHPTVEKLPDPVVALMQKGMSINDAYAFYETNVFPFATKAQELEEKVKAKETNASNAAASMGPVGGSPETQGKLTKEAYESMSQADQDRLWPRARVEIYGFKD